MEPFVLLLALTQSNPHLEAVFVPSDASRAEQAGLRIEDDAGSTYMGNFEIQRLPPTATVDVDRDGTYLGNFEIQQTAPDSDEVLPRLDPGRALPLEGLAIDADLGWAAVGVGRVSANPTPHPGPVLEAADVSSVESASFLIDGVEVEGVVVLTDGHDAVGVLGLPVLPAGRDQTRVEGVHLVLQDASRW